MRQVRFLPSQYHKYQDELRPDCLKTLTWLTLSWMTGDFVPDNIFFEQFCYWESIFLLTWGKKLHALPSISWWILIKWARYGMSWGWTESWPCCFVTSAWTFCSSTVVSGCKSSHLMKDLEASGGNVKPLQWKCKAIRAGTLCYVSLYQRASLSTVIEPTSVIASHWICSTVHWDKDFNNTGSSILILFCLILSAVMHWLLPKSFHCTESTIF